MVAAFYIWKDRHFLPPASVSANMDRHALWMQSNLCDYFIFA